MTTLTKATKFDRRAVGPGPDALRREDGRQAGLGATTDFIASELSSLERTTRTKVFGFLLQASAGYQ